LEEILKASLLIKKISSNTGRKNHSKCWNSKFLKKIIKDKKNKYNKLHKILLKVLFKI
jgi:hypothetical protein